MSATTICFANIKGGVGKTTVAINVAHALATELERKVLLVDMDPQINATTALLDFETTQKFRASHHSVYNFFDTRQAAHGLAPERNVRPADVRPVATNHGFDLILGALDTAFLELRSLDRGHALSLNGLKKGLKAIDAYRTYDHILIDTPPTPSVYLIGALMASDFFVAPCKVDHLSVQGLGLFARVYQTLWDNKDFPLQAKPLGVVLTLSQNKAQEKEGRERVEELERLADYFQPDFFRLFDGCLPSCAKVAKEQAAQRLILELAPKGDSLASAQLAIRKIAGELSRRVAS